MSLRWSFQSSRRRTTGPLLPTPDDKIKKAAAHVVEALESRRLLDATQQFIYTWEHLSPVARHDLAVLETVYPEATVQLDTYVESLGLAPIAPEAGTLLDVPDTAAKGKLGIRHHKPPRPHPKPKPRHHGKDGGSAPTVSSVSYQNDTLPNQITINFSQSVSSGVWSSTQGPQAVNFINLKNHDATSTVLPATYETTLSTPTSAVFDLNNNLELTPDGNYAAIIHGSEIGNSNGGVIGSDGVSGHDYVYDFSFHQADFNNDGAVNSADLQIVLANLNRAGGFNEGNAEYSPYGINSSDLSNRSPQPVEPQHRKKPLNAPTTPYVTGSTNANSSISIALTSSDVDANSFDIYRNSNNNSTWIANVSGTSYTESLQLLQRVRTTISYVAHSSSFGNSLIPSGVLVATTAPQTSQADAFTDELPATAQSGSASTSMQQPINWINAISVINLNTQQPVVPSTGVFSDNGDGTYSLTYSFNSTVPLADGNYAASIFFTAP